MPLSRLLGAVQKKTYEEIRQERAVKKRKLGDDAYFEESDEEPELPPEQVELVKAQADIMAQNPFADSDDDAKGCASVVLSHLVLPLPTPCRSAALCLPCSRASIPLSRTTPTRG